MLLSLSLLLEKSNACCLLLMAMTSFTERSYTASLLLLWKSWHVLYMCRYKANRQLNDIKHHLEESKTINIK